MLLLVPFFVIALVVWWNGNPRTVSAENARTPYVAGVSVLAIAIPLVANLTFEVSKATQRDWIVGLLLAAMTFALIALVLGTYFVYNFSLQSVGNQVQVSGRLAVCMTIQYAAMFLFLFVSFFGLASFIIVARYDSTPSSQGSQRLTSTKPLPDPGSDKAEILEAWGKPDVQGKTWLTYRTADSTVVFCLEDLEDTALVDKVIVAEAKEDPNAVRTDCKTYR
jgi:hypothetical protein